MADEIDANQIDPSFLTDGLGVRGEEFPGEDQSDLGSDELEIRTDGMDDAGEIGGGGGCEPPGGDTSKIYVRATHYVDGEWTCYWLETDTCP